MTGDQKPQAADRPVTRSELDDVIRQVARENGALVVVQHKFDRHGPRGGRANLMSRETTAEAEPVKPERPQHWPMLLLNLYHDCTTSKLAQVIDTLRRHSCCPYAREALELACSEMRCRNPQVLH